MGNQLLSSKIVTEEEQPRIRSVPALPTAVCAAVGVTQKGPVNVATLCNSFEDYVRIFGGYIASSHMTASASAFFQNGGNQLWVVRIVHYTDITSAITKASTAATLNLANATPATTLVATGKYDGTYANDLDIKISAATSGEAAFFNLQVLDGSGLILETFPNLTMTSTDARYVETVINSETSGSAFIAVNDAEVAGIATERRPVNGTFSLATGTDGLTSLADTDYIGSSASGTGLRALDIVDDLTMLMVPGVATSAVHNAMIAYGDVTRNQQVFSVLDPPAGNSGTQIVTYVETTAAILDLSEMAAIYWPRVKILNPNKAVFGTSDQITVPPSGYVCGAIARTDNARVGGVYDSPAGIERGVLYGVLGFETNDVLKEEVRDLVFPKAINPIRTEAGKPRYIDGGRTLKRNGNWPQVHQRRGASHIERTVKQGLDFVRHSNNDADGDLRGTATRTTYAFLKSQMDVGAFSSKDPTKAFFVDFGAALNPASKANIVTGRIGLTMITSAEFVVLKFSQDTRAIDAELAS